MSTYRRYSQEFKDEAIALAKSPEMSIGRAAKDLGMAESTLHRWVSQSAIDKGEKDGLTTDERKELAQLKRENRILKEEREILKKAAVWFAQESETR
ncbi:MAG: transposase [Solirubrobacterales bacterium]|jgi:transposase